jgi:hypothetical protein
MNAVKLFHGGVMTGLNDTNHRGVVTMENASLPVREEDVPQIHCRQQDVFDGHVTRNELSLRG